MEAAKDAASRRRVDQPVKFPDANDLLTAIMAFLDVRAVGLAAQMSRRWHRAATTPAHWQGFVQRRWPTVWSGLAAPKALDARALYCRLACPRPRRETTPEGVLLQFELVVDKKLVLSATGPLDEIQRLAAASSNYYENTLRLRPTPSAAYDALVAQAAAEDHIRNRAGKIMVGKRVGEMGWTEALEQAGGVPSRMIEGTARASISLIRRADGAVVRTELELMAACGEGIEFTGTIYPIQPERSWVRRRAMARQDKHEATLRAAGATPEEVERKRRGGDVRELGLDLYLTFDGRPKDFPIGFSETDPEAWQPGDIALIFREDTFDGFCELPDGDKDQGCVGIEAGYSSSMKLDTCALDGLEWSGV